VYACVVLYTRCRCICCVSGVDACIAWCCMMCNAHYVYVHMVEEKVLGAFRVWKLIRSAYGIRTKIEAKD